MEDISRELEREIAQSKPKPFKKDQKKRILIVDDFGRIRSGEFLQTALKVLSVVSVVCFILAVLFFNFYSRLSAKSQSIRDRLVSAENNVDRLTKEKELLMARLVISGKKLESGTEEKTDIKATAQTPAEKKTAPLKEKSEGLAAAVPKEKQVQAQPEKQAVKPALETGDKVESALDQKPEQAPANGNTVAIEKFTVTKDASTDDLLVRFDIRNISKLPGDVSGRIFTVLKPHSLPEDQWLVVPTVPLKNGMPVEFRKGQYFSIAHFKPVKFRIRNTAGPDFFKTAAIYIFNNQGDLIFTEVINIQEAAES